MEEVDFRKVTPNRPDLQGVAQCPVGIEMQATTSLYSTKHLHHHRDMGLFRDLAVPAEIVASSVELVVTGGGCIPKREW